MLRWLKKHFIPHEENDHEPHFLRTENIQILTAVVFAVELFVLALPFMQTFTVRTSEFMAAILPAVLDDLSNANRQAENLPTLAVNPVLNHVAELKAQDMAAKGYFAHTSPEGKAPWYWFKLAGYNYEYAGENLAIDFTDSQDVDVAWMNSPTHRANIVKSAYTEMGTGVAAGTFEGVPTIFVAQVYGKPAPVFAQAAVGEQLTAPAPVQVAPKVTTTSGTIASASHATSKITTHVMGAETETFADIKLASAGADVHAPVATDAPLAYAALPAEVRSGTPAAGTAANPQPQSQATLLQKMLASPRYLASVILFVIAALVGLALILKTFIRMDKRHPVLMTNGLVLLALIAGVYTVNAYMSQHKLQTRVTFESFQSDVLGAAGGKAVEK